MKLFEIILGLYNKIELSTVNGFSKKSNSELLS